MSGLPLGDQGWMDRAADALCKSLPFACLKGLDPAPPLSRAHERSWVGREQASDPTMGRGWWGHHQLG